MKSRIQTSVVAGCIQGNVLYPYYGDARGATKISEPVDLHDDLVDAKQSSIRRSAGEILHVDNHEGSFCSA
jgi:hypothetical protein